MHSRKTAQVLRIAQDDRVTGNGRIGAAYFCLPEPLRTVSLEELSLDEDSFEELSFDELSFEELSDFGLSSFFSFDEESPLLPDEPGDDDFLA